MRGGGGTVGCPARWGILSASACLSAPCVLALCHTLQRVAGTGPGVSVCPPGAADLAWKAGTCHQPHYSLRTGAQRGVCGSRSTHKRGATHLRGQGRLPGRAGMGGNLKDE